MNLPQLKARILFANLLQCLGVQVLLEKILLDLGAHDGVGKSRVALLLENIGALAAFLESVLDGLAPGSLCLEATFAHLHCADPLCTLNRGRNLLNGVQRVQENLSIKGSIVGHKRHRRRTNEIEERRQDFGQGPTLFQVLIANAMHSRRAGFNRAVDLDFLTEGGIRFNVLGRELNQATRCESRRFRIDRNESHRVFDPVFDEIQVAVHTKINSFRSLVCIDDERAIQHSAVGTQDIREIARSGNDFPSQEGPDFLTLFFALSIFRCNRTGKERCDFVPAQQDQKTAQKVRITSRPIGLCCPAKAILDGRRSHEEFANLFFLRCRQSLGIKS